MYKHKLAALGDSISQGFQNSAIYRTELSFPAMLARSLGDKSEFRQPRFAVRGGIPVNLDYILRSLERHYEKHLDWRDYPKAVAEVYSIIRKTKRYWEGKEQPLTNDINEPFHNQSVWGLTTNDAWMLDEEISENFIKNNPVHYAVFNFLPDHALYTTAKCVLNPSGTKKFRNHTLIDNIRELSDDGGIENLIINLGSNHIVGAVTKMRFQYSEPDEIEAHPYQRQYTVMRPEHFEQNYRKLAKMVKEFNVGKVVVATIPYITIAPILKGINSNPPEKNSEYFDYYTNFWINEENFNPEQHKHFTRTQAIDLDIAVDHFNAIIKKVAEENGWVLADVGRYVDVMAYRRHQGKLHLPFPKGLVDALNSFPKTQYLVDGKKVHLDTRYLKTDTDTHNLLEGGIFSLDGLHPTTTGYGLIANIVMEAMKDAGVMFENNLDWEFIIRNDSLVYDPPILLNELKDIYRLFSGFHQEVKKLSDPDKIIEPLFGFWRDLRFVR